ncbi:MAG: TPM domain-containing protein [Eubacteriales bacterium]
MVTTVKKRMLRAAAMLFIAVIIASVMPTFCFAGQQYVFDNADLFSPDQEEELNALCEKYSEKSEMNFAIMTSDEENGGVMQYADDAYDALYYDGSYTSGCLFLIDMYNRKPWLTTSGDMIGKLSDSFIDDLVNGDIVHEYLVDGEYNEAAKYVIDGVYGHMYNSLSAGEFIVAAVIGAIVALIFKFSVSHGYELKGSQYTYDVKSNSNVKLRVKTDAFTHTTVTRTPRSDSSSNSGSGGGSSSHTSSSGNSHGGGGGRSF